MARTQHETMVEAAAAAAQLTAYANSYAQEMAWGGRVEADRYRYRNKRVIAELVKRVRAAALPVPAEFADL